MEETMSRLEFENEGDKEYEIKAIRDSAIYVSESESHLPGLDYLVSWKGYPEEENTLEPALAMLHLCKLINTFHCDHQEKPTVTFPRINSAPPMTRPTVKPRAEASNTKQKEDRPAKANGTNKFVKKSLTSSFLSHFWPYLNRRQKDLLSHVIFSSAPLRSA